MASPHPAPLAAHAEDRTTEIEAILAIETGWDDQQSMDAPSNAPATAAALPDIKDGLLPPAGNPECTFASASPEASGIYRSPTTGAIGEAAIVRTPDS